MKRVVSFILLFNFSFSNVKVAIKDMGSLDLATSNNSSIHVVSNMYEPLLRVDNGKIVSGSGRVIKIKGNKIYFKISSKFHDGSSVNASDYLESFKKILTESSYSNRYFVVKNASEFAKGEVSFSEVGIKAEEDILEITLNNRVEDPISFYGSLFAFPSFSPIRKGKYNGPFYLHKFSDNSVILKRNLYYENSRELKSEKCKKIDEIEFIAIKDSETAINMFKNDEIDLILKLSSLDLDRIPCKAYKSNFRTIFLAFNLERVKKEIREAIASIDKSRILEFFPQYEIANSIIPNNYYGFNFSNREKKSDKSYKGTLKLLSSTTRTARLVCEILRQELEKIGIELEITFLPYILRNRLLKKGDYEIYLSGWSVDHESLPFDFLTMFLSDSEENIFNWKNEEFDKLMYNAINTYKKSDKLKLLKKAENIINRENVVLPLYHPKSFYSIKERLKGVKIHSGALSPDFREAYLEEN